MPEKPDEGEVIVNGNGDADYISFDKNLISYVATSDNIVPTEEVMKQQFLTVSLTILSSAPLMIATLSDIPEMGSMLEEKSKKSYMYDSKVIETLDDMHCTPAGKNKKIKLPAYAHHNINGKSCIYIDLSNSW